MGAALRSRRSLVLVSVLAAASLIPTAVPPMAAAMPAAEAPGTWGPPRVVNPGEGAYGWELAWSSAGTVLHALSSNQDGGDYYQRTTDDGATWQDRVRVGGVNSWESLIATADSHVYVVNHRGGIKHDWMVLRRNSDDGRAGAWTAPTAISSPRSRVVPSTMTASSSIVHIAATRMAVGSYNIHTRKYGGQVVVRSSRDHGATWTTHVLARLDRAALRAVPVVAASGRHVVVAWRVSGAKTVVRARVSHDSGRTWGATTALGAGITISAAALGSRVAVAAGTRENTLWVRVHRAGSWKKVRVVPVGASKARTKPAVALHGTSQIGVVGGRYPADGSGLVLQWHESADNGATWATPVTIGKAEFGQVLWSSTGALTIAYLTYQRTRA